MTSNARVQLAIAMMVTMAFFWAGVLQGRVQAIHHDGHHHESPMASPENGADPHCGIHEETGHDHLAIVSNDSPLIGRVIPLGPPVFHVIDWITLGSQAPLSAVQSIFFGRPETTQYAAAPPPLVGTVIFVI